MHRPRSLTAVAVAAIGLLLLLPATALAHASFDVAQLPAGSTQDLVLRVPLEREAVNDLVEVLVPGAFAVESCDAAEGWTCEQDETSEGNVVVTLSRAPDGPGDTERFGLTVTAPAEQGVYAFPTIQTYDDGEEVSWIGEEESDRPAPRIQVGEETTEVEFSEDTPHTELSSEEPTASPTETDDPASPEDVDETEEPIAAATEGATDGATEGAADGPTVAETDPEAEAPVGEGEGGPSATVLLVGAALLVAFAIAVVVARRRQT